jgi:penicillin-binding protein 1A
MATRLGITHEVPPYPSITLGTIGVSPLEMATVYSTFAAEGIKHDPVFITKLKDRDGRVIFAESKAGRRVLSAEVARTETSILQGVIRSGTGTRARLMPGDRAVGKGKVERFAAGKTGTTDDKTNAWFVGYTPDLVAAVWMGDPAAYTPMKNVGSVGAVFGGTYPAMIWKAFMDAALKGRVVREFAKPNERLWPAASSITEAGRGARLPFDPSGATGPSGPEGPSGVTAPPTSTTLSPTTSSNPPSTSTIPPPL